MNMKLDLEFWVLLGGGLGVLFLIYTGMLLYAVWLLRVLGVL